MRAYPVGRNVERCSVIKKSNIRVMGWTFELVYIRLVGRKSGLVDVLQE